MVPVDPIPFPALLSPGPPEAAGDLIPLQAGGGRVETGASVSLDLALGGVSRSHVCGGERGGVRGWFVLHVPRGLVGNKGTSHPCSQVCCFWGSLGESRGRAWEAMTTWLFKYLLCAGCFVSTHCACAHVLEYTQRASKAVVRPFSGFLLSTDYWPGAVCSSLALGV